MSIEQRKVLDRYLTETEERQLFRTVKNTAGVLAERDCHWMRLLRNTGIRITPLASITCGDAREALRLSKLQLRHSKGGNNYSVPITKGARQALMGLLSVRRRQGFAEAIDAPLIMGQHKRGLCVRQLQKRMEHWVTVAGLDIQASPHWFRHTMGQRLMKNSTAQNPLNVVQQVLGHRDIRSTGVYTNPTREEIQQHMEEVSA